MWQFPWRYRESIAITAGIVLTGFVLQFTVGAFDFTRLRRPVNFILGGIIILLLALFSIKRESPFCRWFSGAPMAVTLIGATVILGITCSPSAWPFVLVYLLILLSLGAVIARRMIPFRIKNYAFYLNHTGLWLLLFAAGMGASDVRNYVMYVREGETGRSAYNEKGDTVELPFGIELNDFYMEEYPPQLVVIEKETGVAQPPDKPRYFQIDEKQREGKIGDRHIILLKEYIHEAVRSRDGAYREVRMPGASPAAKIEVRNPKTGITREGWVCAGNIAQPYAVLDLDERYCIAATRPEPKRFVSDINIYTKNGTRRNILLEVNKPYKSGHWTLYQYGYDSEAGNMSAYSSIELVYDPWITPVYAGIILLACGSVCMLWSGNKRKEEAVDDVG